MALHYIKHNDITTYRLKFTNFALLQCKIYYELKDNTTHTKHR